MAVKNENLEIVNFLLENKANIHIRTRAGTGIAEIITKSSIRNSIERVSKKQAYAV